jgi:hypothetical protein
LGIDNWSHFEPRNYHKFVLQPKWLQEVPTK